MVKEVIFIIVGVIDANISREKKTKSGQKTKKKRKDTNKPDQINSEERI